MIHFILRVDLILAILAFLCVSSFYHGFKPLAEEKPISVLHIAQLIAGTIAAIAAIAVIVNTLKLLLAGNIA